jgi:hypothetical protein
MHLDIFVSKYIVKTILFTKRNKMSYNLVQNRGVTKQY